jgi:hypothetical protein
MIINFNKFLNEKISEGEFADALRKDLIKEFLDNVKKDKYYNEDEVDIDSLLGPYEGYRHQTYIQNIKPGKEFIIYEGFSEYCWKSFLNQKQYKNLDKYEIIKNFINERCSKLGEEFGYKLEDYEIKYIELYEFEDYYISLHYIKNNEK